MRDVVVVGAGKIGATIADMLAASGDYRVAVVDRSPEALAEVVAAGVTAIQHDLADETGLARLLAGRFAVLSAAPYHLTAGVARAAYAAGCHYLDLTEDVATTRSVRELARQGSRAFIPQCGLAPGFISIVATALAQRFERLDSVKLRVGALPQFPSNALNYNLTWSTDGVINEYCEPCEAIVDGVRREVPPMEELEEFSLDGVRYEAFNTSGGLGSLCETLAGRVRQLNYRTIRYPGHCALMKALLVDLRLRDRRHVLKDILEHALPTTMQDVVVVLVAVSGWQGERLVQTTYANRIHGGMVGGRRRSAIQVTTAAGIAAVLDLLAEGAIPATGLVRQEDIPLDRFLANRFGRAYAMEDRQALAA
ncbi:saccharopine dehydrogenase [Allostella sp. ATCC 35155]|nr:saccharopine dehydrogenase [Stella sp. ATCC 35155]